MCTRQEKTFQVHKFMAKDEIHEVVQNVQQINIRGTAMYKFTKKLSNVKRTNKHKRYDDVQIH